MTPQPLDDAQAAERERSAFFDAVRASTQTVPGLFAWGVVTGAALMQSFLSLWQSLLMTLVSCASTNLKLPTNFSVLNVLGCLT